MITYNKHDTNLITAMGADVVLIHEATQIFSGTVVETGDKAIAIGKIYQKALESEEWMKVLMVFAISGVQDCIEKLVKRLMENSPELARLMSLDEKEIDELIAKELKK